MPPRIVFTDMEGTLFQKAVDDAPRGVAKSAWTAITEALGPDALAAENQTKEKWVNNEYDGYVEWMDATIRIHQEHGLTRDMFTRVLSALPYYPGVKQVFSALNNAGVITALVTGGFKMQAERAQRELELDHVFAACEYYWGEDGELAHWNLLPCDYEGKKEFMQLILNEHGLDWADAAFIGDGENDVPLAKAAGTSIAFAADKPLKQVADHVVPGPDFTAVQQYLDLPHN